MSNRAFAPIPTAVAVLFAAAPFLGSFAAPLAGKPVSATPQVAATAPAAARQATRQYVLKTGVANGKMVYIDDKGVVNPVLRGNVGDTIEITLSSGEGAQHDIVITELGVKSKMFDGKSGPAKISFKLTQAGK